MVILQKILYHWSFIIHDLITKKCFSPCSYSSLEDGLEDFFLMTAGFFFIIFMKAPNSVLSFAHIYCIES